MLGSASGISGCASAAIPRSTAANRGVMYPSKGSGSMEHYAAMVRSATPASAAPELGALSIYSSFHPFR
jgi:hypothetical protein